MATLNNLSIIPQILVITVFATIYFFHFFNGIGGMPPPQTIVGNHYFGPSSLFKNNNNFVVPKLPTSSNFSFNKHPKYSSPKQKLKITTKASYDNNNKYKINAATTTDAIVHKNKNIPQKEEEIIQKNNEKKIGENNVPTLITQKEINKDEKKDFEQVKNKREEISIYSKLIEQINWDLTKFKKLELNDEKNKLIQTVTNILVPYVENNNKKEENYQIAEVVASNFIFALIEAERINSLKKYIEYVEEKLIELEEERVVEEFNDDDKNENIINTEIGGERVEQMEKFNKKIENIIEYAEELKNVFNPIIRDNNQISVENKVKNQINLMNSFTNNFNRVVNETNDLNENEKNGQRVVIEKMMEELKEAERVVIATGNIFKAINNLRHM